MHSRGLLSILPFLLSTVEQVSSSSSCRYIPGDTDWPGAGEWNRLNDTVQGRLMATVPMASICHGPNPDEAACKELRDDWTNMLLSESMPHGIMAPYWQNASCDPFHAQSEPGAHCSLGNHVAYAINASSANDIVAGVQFAKEKNIRLVIKNTGHDTLGNSIGFGALAIWTHNMRSTEFIPTFKSAEYIGPAMKLGAGVRGFEALEAATDHGKQVMVGYCPTVGVVGGYLQGGGSGPLASKYGFAADQTLEFEVVLASGEIVTASPTKNQDIYWALSGGGGGTYGVVVSATVRAFEDGVVGGASLKVPRDQPSMDIETVYELLGKILHLGPTLTAAGWQYGATISNGALNVHPITAPDHTVAQIMTKLQPFVSELEERGIQYSLQVSSKPNYKQHFETYLGPLPGGIYRATAMAGNRLVPRETIEKDMSKLVAATRHIVEDSSLIINFLVANVTKTPSKQPVADNALLPRWRETTAEAMIYLPWNYTEAPQVMRARHANFIENIVPSLAAALPKGAGSYMNEANVGVATWKEDFYGENYDALQRIKSKYDPSGLFWGATTVGSDAWYKAEDGRLCRSSPDQSDSQRSDQQVFKTEL